MRAGDLIPDRALRARDRDAFDYAPIAARIAELCCVAEPPINIALFAPWGSGKSSLFTLIEAGLEEREMRTKLIRYDAWRYGGRALRRNFISHTARELRLPEDDPRYGEFHRGLYQNQRRVTFSLAALWRQLTRGHLTPLVAIGLVGLLVGIVLALDAVLVGAIASTVVALAAAIIEAGKVEVEQSRPSEDEEFSARFGRLIDLATQGRSQGPGERQRLIVALRTLAGKVAERSGLYELRMRWSGWIAPQPIRGRMPASYERLVFFIDELDRCSPSDIAETLKALRTFLDAENCVFVVAADRDVLEASLPKLEQTTPINEERPYYSSAGAYLDKIFQHQLTLPPLRSVSLAKYARELAQETDDGIWSELMAIDGAPDGTTPALDRVLFILIPSHVYSPRRIKVLLNNFATNARITSSRLLDAWPERREEIARLTAFQTEFAEFAEDLALEPRLPGFLLARIRDPQASVPQTTMLQRMLAHWDLSSGSVAESEEGKGGATEAGESGEQEPAEAEEQIASAREASDEEHREATREARRRAKERRLAELRRYIERTDEMVPRLRRDLFYLRSAGLDVDLDDPALAELIESEATDAPQRVIAALEGRDPKQLKGAARLLGGMVGNVLGPEQGGVMSALMAVMVMLGDELDRGLAREVAGALGTYWSANILGDDHLIGALRVGISARDFDPTIVARVLGDWRLFSVPEQVAAVISMSAGLRVEELGSLRGGIASQLAAGREQIIAAITGLGAAEQRRLVDDDAFFEAIGNELDREAEVAASEGEGEA
jgi:KAP family P-loop domain